MQKYLNVKRDNQLKIPAPDDFSTSFYTLDGREVMHLNGIIMALRKALRKKRRMFGRPNSSNHRKHDGYIPWKRNTEVFGPSKYGYKCTFNDIHVSPPLSAYS